MHVFGEPPAGGEDGAPPTLDAGVAYVVREGAASAGACTCATAGGRCAR